MGHHHHHDYHHHHHHHPKSTGVAYLLWFFLGVFGAHRFYLQRYTSGFIWLFTCGVFGIGWLVDLFILAGMVRHFNNHYFSDPTVIVAPAPIVYQNQPYQPQAYGAYQPQPYYAAPPSVQPYQPQPYNATGGSNPPPAYN
ncbi:TM2 domain-containing protein [Cavenderia fasciculata]|uniref:TM2 domain-containing protein n=1 Tax=Cavenderia fasciculata TaxID=261658 RepID=F4PQA7_CACFS|nr:TM2 domain-containing protein [Cavenderia fasciculata]EGG22570.1 TM2 domain-containing protein [Cavenderia fasciculata]|eukprot:XP_004360421.1 TM2 domain-containing protein [Cavenderia fasciculata]